MLLKNLRVQQGQENLEVEGVEETSFSPYPDKWDFPQNRKGKACGLAGKFLFSCVICVPKDCLYGDSPKLRSSRSHELTRTYAFKAIF